MPAIPLLHDTNFARFAIRRRHPCSILIVFYDFLAAAIGIMLPIPPLTITLLKSLLPFYNYLYIILLFSERQSRNIHVYTYLYALVLAKTLRF